MVTVQDGGVPDYTDAHEATVSPGDRRSAEQWFRALFGETAAPVRWFLVVGWRAVLLLRLGPLGSPGYVLGWRVVESAPGAARLRVESPLMTAELSLHLAGATAVLRSSLTYRRAITRPIWAVVGLIHRRMIRHLLRRAAGGGRTGTAGQ
jgi:hypothetical protein